MGSNDTERAIEKCNQHARKLIDSARLLVDHDASMSAAYHLALLAIEEIGKASLLKISQLNTMLGKESTFDRRLDDHYQKLFWAFFLPGFATNKLTRADLEQARALAGSMHRKRLASLYVSHTDEEFLLVISKEEALQAVQLAEARLGLEALFTSMPDERRLDDLKWVMDTMTDERLRPFVFSRESMKRLASNSDAAEWVSWLREQIGQYEQQMHALFEKEAQRERPSEENELKDKWKMRIRLTIPSHSIRQKVFKLFNEHSSFAKFYEADKKKREMIVELRLPYAVPVAGLWHHAYGIVNRLLVAFNIGALGGFCWWYALNREHVFYEELVDLEHDAQLKLELKNEYLYVNWGKRALSEIDMQRFMMVFAFLPKHDSPEEEKKPFDYYLTGLAFLGKTDLHLNLTPNACEFFLRSLVAAMKFHGDMRDDEGFGSAFERNIGYIFKDPIERQTFVDLAAKLERVGSEKEGGFESLTYDKVLQTKLLCDTYLLRKFGEMADARAATEGGSSPTD